MRDVEVAIIGAGPYGLSLAAHFAERKIEHRIFGRPMQFWSQVADAADQRYLKSYCFGTNLSAPEPGFSFSDYNTLRNLETFEPCSMANFAAYGLWFQKNRVPWVEPVDVLLVKRHGDRFAITLSTGERFVAEQVVVATGLSSFSNVPRPLSSMPSSLVTHTSDVAAFSSFKGLRVAVLGAGQSALEAAVLLHEAGAEPTLLVRERTISWHTRIQRKRSLWRRLRSPITGLGTGPKAWLLTRFPRALHRMPDSFRTRFVKTHLPAEGAWWLRERFDGKIPVQLETEVIEASETPSGVKLVLHDSKQHCTRETTVDHVIAGSGYTVDVDRLKFLEDTLCNQITRIERSPKAERHLRVVCSRTAFRRGGLRHELRSSLPLRRRADYTARTISKHLSSRMAKAEATSEDIASEVAAAT